MRGPSMQIGKGIIGAQLEFTAVQQNYSVRQFTCREIVALRRGGNLNCLRVSLAGIESQQRDAAGVIAQALRKEMQSWSG